jgi:TDG/mug DNA glycosylase family protein
VYESGLTDHLFKSTEDAKLLERRIGLINMFERASAKTVQDLSSDEVKQAQLNLKQKITHFRPKVVAFNGKSIYETYLGASVKSDFNFGKQPLRFDNNTSQTIMFVLPSSSARCSQLPKVVDKVPFYSALRQLSEHLNGRLPSLTDLDITFPDFKVALNTGSSPTVAAASDIDDEMDVENDNDDASSEKTGASSSTGNGKKHEHKIRFVRLNNLPYSQLPANIIQSLNEQRKSKKGITITTNKNMFNVPQQQRAGSKTTSARMNAEKNGVGGRKAKAGGSVSNSDLDTASSSLTNDSNSLSDYNNLINFNHNVNNGDACVDKSNIGSIVLNLVSNGNPVNVKHATKASPAASQPASEPKKTTLNPHKFMKVTVNNSTVANFTPQVLPAANAGYLYQQPLHQQQQQQHHFQQQQINPSLFQGAKFINYQQPMFFDPNNGGGGGSNTVNSLTSLTSQPASYFPAASLSNSGMTNSSNFCFMSSTPSLTPLLNKPYSLIPDSTKLPQQQQQQQQLHQLKPVEMNNGGFAMPYSIPITFELLLKPDKKYTQSDFFTFEAAQQAAATNGASSFMTMSSPMQQQQQQQQQAQQLHQLQPISISESNAELNRQIKLIYSNEQNSSDWKLLDDINGNGGGAGPVFKSINEATGNILQKFYLNKNKSEGDTAQCKLDFNVL